MRREWHVAVWGLGQEMKAGGAEHGTSISIFGTPSRRGKQRRPPTIAHTYMRHSVDTA